MRARVYVREDFDVYMGIDLGGFESGMAQHFLYKPDVRAIAVHVRGHRVAQQVAGTGFGDVGFFHLSGDPGAEIGGGDAGAVAAEEERGFVGQMIEERAGFGEEAVEPEGGPATDGQEAAFVVLAMADQQGVGGGVVVAGVELGHFGAPYAGGVEEFEDGAVAQAHGIGGVGQREEPVEFFRAEGFGEAAGLLAGQIEVGGGIGGEGAAATEPGEETPDAAEATELGVDPQWLFGARRAVMVEVELISFDGGTGKGAGGGEIQCGRRCEWRMKRAV